MFIGVFGALLTLPFVFVYVGAFAGLFVLLRHRAASGFLAGISASAIAYALYSLVSMLILTSTGSGTNPITLLIGGLALIAWCGFAAEILRPLLGNYAHRTPHPHQRER